jgi:hypothetical protein
MSEIVQRFYSTGDIARLIEKSHRTARNKGWWTIKNGKAVVMDLDEKIVLVISELAEAFEDYRNPKRDIKEIYAVGAAGEVPWEDRHTTMEPMPKPDGFPVEMADAYIRLCDLAGALEVHEVGEVLVHTDGRKQSIGAIVRDLMSSVLLFEKFHADAEWFAMVFAGIEGACRELDVDLHRAMDLKMIYNDTRPVRHGGKRA